MEWNHGDFYSVVICSVVILMIIVTANIIYICWNFLFIYAAKLEDYPGTMHLMILKLGGDTLPVIHAFTHAVSAVGIAAFKILLATTAKICHQLWNLFNFRRNKYSRIHCHCVVTDVIWGGCASRRRCCSTIHLFSGLRCNSEVYCNFTITWDWHKHSQIYLSTKYLSKSNWIVITKWKSIELLNSYSEKCRYISDTF